MFCNSSTNSITRLLYYPIQVVIHKEGCSSKILFDCNTATDSAIVQNVRCFPIDASIHDVKFYGKNNFHFTTFFLTL